MLLLCCLLFPFIKVSAFSGGSGTEADPWLISTPAELASLNDYLGSGHSDKYFKLANDIDLNVEPYNTDPGWTPIGNSSNSFYGHVDGNSKRIFNLYINNNSSFQGLFGHLSGSVTDLGLENIDITVGSYSGGFIGGNSGDVNRCFVTGNLIGTGNIVGGFVGEVNIGATVQNSYSDVNVTRNVDAQAMGGFAGNVYAGSISNSYSLGSVTATAGSDGIASFTGALAQGGTATNSYAIGPVSCTGSCSSYHGFNGFNQSASSCNYWDTETTGRSTSNGGTGKTTAEMKLQETYIDWDFDTVWAINENINGGYPYLQWAEAYLTTPETQSSNILFSGISYNQLTLSWTKGDASNRIIFAKEASSGTTSPVDATTYTADASFGSGSQIDSTGWYAVYKGNDSTATVTNLDSDTEYIFQIFEYNGSPGKEEYLTSTSTDNPKSISTLELTTPTIQASNITFSSEQYNQFNLNWENGNGEKRVVFLKEGSSGSVTLDNQTTYSANSAFESGANIGDWYAVYNGTGTSVTVTDLNPNTEYRAQVIEYNGTAGIEMYLNDTENNNPISGTTIAISEPTTQAYDIAISNIRDSSANISWNKGNGVNSIVFMRRSSTGYAEPVNDITYSANPSFGDGNQIGSSGWYAVYKGTGTSVTVSGLISERNYIVHVIGYNGPSGDEKYLLGSSSNNPNTFTTTSVLQSEDFETGDFSLFNWEFSGDLPWEVSTDFVYDGSFSARSGPITDSQSSILTITLNIAEDGNISFFRKVSTEAGYDKFYFYIDDDEKETVSGNIDWVQSTWSVTAGERTFKWKYEKDGSVSDHEDTVFIDNISFPTIEQNLPPEHTLTYTTGEGGSILGDISQTITDGDNGSQVEAVPNTGYYFLQWDDGLTDNPRTDFDIGYDKNVEAQFAIYQYNLSYSAPSYGSISGSSSQIVNYGLNGTAVEAVPMVGYHFVKWSDDVTDNPRTDSNITSNLTVVAEFAINEYSLSYSTSSNGSILGNINQTVEHGSNSSSVTAVPNTGYHFVKWSDDVTDNPRVDSNVSKNISVQAVFAINTYSVIYRVGSNGVGIGSAMQTINYNGSTSNIQIIPVSGYRFVGWSDGITANPRRDIGVKSNIDVTAIYELIPPATSTTQPTTTVPTTTPTQTEVAQPTTIPTTSTQTEIAQRTTIPTTTTTTQTEITQEQKPPLEKEEESKIFSDEEKKKIVDEGKFVSKAYIKDGIIHISDVIVRIVDDSGRPISGLKVYLYSKPRIAYTDNDGFAVFKDVPVGEHHIEFDYGSSKYKEILAIATPEIKGDSDEEEVEIQLVTIEVKEEDKNVSWLSYLLYIGGFVATVSVLFFILKRK